MPRSPHNYLPFLLLPLRGFNVEPSPTRFMLIHTLPFILYLVVMQTQVIFDFTPNADLSGWYVVDDGVMGGRSAGAFRLSVEGNGVFSGTVSLANNGGFSSVRYPFARRDVRGGSKVVIRLRGDGKDYQFRVKTNARDYYSFITTFSTSGDWQVVEIPFGDLYPSFRGRRLNQPNFSGEALEEIGFLIGNKQAEDFMLLIDKIELQ